jgi:hypothetical protein
MGYTTDFSGAFTVEPPVSAEHMALYREIVETERDEMPTGAPDAYLQWELSDDGSRLEWDGNEKFYHYVDWLTWLIAEWFRPRGYTLSGSVKYQGDDVGDMGELSIADGIVTQERATFGTAEKALREILRRYDEDVLEVEDAADLAREGLGEKR